MSRSGEQLITISGLFRPLRAALILSLLARGLAIAQRSSSQQEIHLNHLRSEALAGNLRAQIEMGLALESGSEADRAEAARWFLAAANQGDPQAQTNIGYLYSVGSGVPRDPERAFMWFQRAAAEGYATAQYDIGTMLVKGDGVKQDFPAALNWFRRAATVGFAPAEVYLGIVYANGKGTSGMTAKLSGGSKRRA